MEIINKIKDQRLIELMSRGCHLAFTEIYKRYWDRVYLQAQKLMEREQSAKDCAQEVFADLWRRRERTQIKSLENYLLQAVRFQVCKLIRRRKMSSEYSKRYRTIYQEGHFFDSLAHKEMQTGLNRTFSSLPEDQRMIFYLNREEAVTYPKIAKKLGISVKTVEKKMSLSLRSLREELYKKQVLQN
jgi:RNA polymerase sigma-70 factor (ECF subfamily)